MVARRCWGATDVDTDYVIDNGYIQVREDGGYVARHNPIFLADLDWTDKPYGFFQFSNSKITLLSHDGKNSSSTDLVELPVIGMQLEAANRDSPSIIVNKANNAFSYTEDITVSKGKLFANMTVIIQSNNPNVSLDWLNFVVDSQGIFQQSFNNTVAMLDLPAKECGQLIFAQNQPIVSNFNAQNPCITQLSYDLHGSSKAEIQILVGMFAVSNNEIQNSGQSGLTERLVTNLQNLPTAPDLPMITFDYKVALQDYKISYIANRNSELNPKYADDPQFTLAFANNEVAIFKVEANATAIKG